MRSWNSKNLFGLQTGISLSNFRFQTTTVSTNEPVPSPETKGDTNPDSSAVAPKDSPPSLTQWSTYRPPAWRLVGVVNHRETRRSARETQPAKPQYVLGSSPDELGAKGALPAAGKPTLYYVHGDRLGPRPLLVLDDLIPYTVAEKLKTSTDGLPITKYAPLLSHLKHPHGALSLPLVGPQGSETSEALEKLPTREKNDFLAALCDDVITMLDTLAISFVGAIVARSTGALVATKLASLYPERVGGLVICDTPLLTQRWVDNHEARNVLLKAAQDVNVPRSELEFAVRSLLDKSEEDGLESNVAATFHSSEATSSADISNFNKAIYEQVIFDRKLVYPTSVQIDNNGKDRAGKTTASNNNSNAITVSSSRAASLRFLSGLASEEPERASSALPKMNNDTESSAPQSISIIEGLYRDNKAYLDPEALATIRHPFMLVQPSVGAVADPNIHRVFFNMRKPTILNLGGEKPSNPTGGESKSGGKKDKKQQQSEPKEAALEANSKKTTSTPSATSIFSESVAPSFAKQLAGFLNRFELDNTLLKRYEQSAADLMTKMSQTAASGVTAPTGGEGGDKKKGKKGKK